MNQKHLFLLAVFGLTVLFDVAIAKSGATDTDFMLYLLPSVIGFCALAFIAGISVGQTIEQEKKDQKTS